MGAYFFVRIFGGNDDETAIFLQPCQIPPLDKGYQRVASLERDFAQAVLVTERFTAAVDAKQKMPVHLPLPAAHR